MAFDSFKGSLTSQEAGEAAARGAKLVFPDSDCRIFEMADGGEGTCDALTRILGGKYISAPVSDPIGNLITASYGIWGDTAIIEVASASGLTLVPHDKQNPCKTTSRGTGEMIADAICRGCRRFILGLGGSAVNDAGTGLLRALGFRFIDANGLDVADRGEVIGEICTIDTSRVMPQLSNCTFTCIYDVDVPLCGPNGASITFGPQKGADKKTAIFLDHALESFGRITTQAVGRDLTNIPGAGSAGGIGFAMAAFLNATLKSGIETVIDFSGFDNALSEANLIITGEGRLDRQTCMGKVPDGVLRHAQKFGIPVIAIGGSIDIDDIDKLNDAGYLGVFSIMPGPCQLSYCMKPEIASANLERTVAQVLRVFGG